MTAPLFVVEPADLIAARSGDTVLLTGTEGRHAASVVRLAVGESVIVVDGFGRRVDCTVGRVLSRDELELSIDSVIDEPAPAVQFAVAQGLPKGDRGELAVEVMTEIGVDCIVPWAAARCVTQWRPDRAEKAHRKWADAARAAAKQARRAWHPRVEALESTSDLASRVSGAALALVLDEEASESIGGVELPAAGEVLLVVGPEGGITPGERESLVAAGARAVRLGPTVLRTSTAGVAALAVLLARTERWSPPGATVGG